MKSAEAFAYLLLGLVCWTVAIKYATPILVATHESLPLSTYILWDAWPLAHLVLAIALLRRSKGIVPLAFVIATAEVVVVIARYAMFFRDPIWDPWRTNWFTNKIFVISLFSAMLIWLAQPKVRARLRGKNVAS